MRCAIQMYVLLTYLLTVCSGEPVQDIKSEAESDDSENIDQSRDEDDSIIDQSLDDDDADDARSSPPFRCAVCDKRFKYKGSLESHARTHDSGKTLQCSTCNKQFITEGRLLRHQVHLVLINFN